MLVWRSVRSVPAPALTFSVGGDFEKNLVVGDFSQAKDMAAGRGFPQRASGGSPQLLSFGGEEEYRYAQNK